VVVAGVVVAGVVVAGAVVAGFVVAAGVVVVDLVQAVKRLDVSNRMSSTLSNIFFTIFPPTIVNILIPFVVDNIPYNYNLSNVRLLDIYDYFLYDSMRQLDKLGARV
jgi:hypothetical protein